VGGLTSTLLSGEGLVMEFTGPGQVWYQTRGLDTFAEAIGARLSAAGDDGSVDVEF
jgi:uncharacterized protein (AIM24 family)